MGYCNGRIDQDPTEGWYKGEIGFFDYYIIPLAKKLKECGVFGVSSDEYLNYAKENRRLWSIRGESIVGDYKIKYANIVKLTEMEEGEEDDDGDDDDEAMEMDDLAPPAPARKRTLKRKTDDSSRRVIMAEDSAASC